MEKPFFIPLKSRGFALVVTLSLMILLTLIAVGLLSLSAVSMRTSSQAMAQAEAQANARLALMIAIGELQKQMGPDQRISANGAMLDTLRADGSVQEPAKNPHWTGVWDSWIAGPVDPDAVNPTYPEKTDPTAQSAHSTIEPLNGGFPANLKTGVMAPKYPPNSSDKGRSDYFRAWLVSLLPADANKAASGKDLVLDGREFPGKTDTAIRLVGSGSSSSTDYVSARLIDAASPMGGKGRFGWWVGDESQKARVLHDSYVSKPPANSAEKIFRGQSPDSTGTKNITDLESLTAAQDLKLDSLASMKTLDLVPADTSKEPARKNFHHITSYSSQVLADVREGGLKRDLSTILEQPIIRTNSGSEYMLYAFNDSRFPNDQSNSRVPIQDLAAYYQLYNDIKPADATYGVNGREGVRYNSSELANAIQVNAPDYDGGSKNRQRILREYTTLYKQPVITKVQYLVALAAQEITQADRDNIQAQINQTISPPSGPNSQATVPVPATETHRLRVGLMPVVTLWNPNNVPMVMDRAQIFRFSNAPPIKLRWKKYRGAGTTYESGWFNLGFLAAGAQQAFGHGSGFAFMELVLAGTKTTSSSNSIVASPVIFQPGEVKTFSLSPALGGKLNSSGNTLQIVQEDIIHNTTTGYDPYGFFLIRHSTPYDKSYCPDVYFFTNGNQSGANMVFNTNDKISLFVDKEANIGGWSSGERVSPGGYIKGAGFAISMCDPGYRTNLNDRLWFLEHYSMLTRHSSTGGLAQQAIVDFNNKLIAPGFPGGVTPIPYDTSTNAIAGSQIIGASAAGEVKGLMEFSLSLGCEAGSLSAGGYGGGRRIATRPFLHSPLGAPPMIDQFDKTSLYNYGWDWQLGKVNDIEDSIIQAEPATGNGFYGGGYTVEAGTTRVVQQEIPVLPALSIAALSHAHLGGFSLGYANNVGDDPEELAPGVKGWRVNSPTGLDYQRTRATGQGGLAPHILQAVGNSYAHPNMPANKAYATWTRRFDEDPGEGDKVVPFVDHSYLANKALWDEFYFSSIAPQPAKVSLFGTSNPTRTTKEVADAFFKLSDPLSSSPLPNRRIKPYTTNLNQSKLDTLFTQAGIYTNGFADKLAAHLMVEGAFNVNSTSVEAWKVFLSSLKGKPVAYLDGGTAPKEATPAGTTISSSSLANGVPVKSTDISDINIPKDQWTSGRELSDDEIAQLARAMVKQVKLRGPFLSMSEFINRRLTSPGADGMALKGALQAALDDPNTSINANFRTPSRLLDSETAGIPFAFPDAAKGPIAYGSMAYVDQADVLRGFAEQITPRGDTFVIRTYGDSIDASGKVVARAWCEAVVQRTPDYVDSLDEPHVKSANLVSAGNRTFGRKIQIASFRWISASEI